MVNDWPPFFSSVDAQGAKPSVLAAEPLRARLRRQHALRFSRKSRPEWSRLSECWSWLSSTASIAPISRAHRGPISFSSFTCGN
jgi:hypothetical protein